MDSVDLDVLKTSAKWVNEGHRAYLATVVRTWGSAPRAGFRNVPNTMSHSGTSA